MMMEEQETATLLNEEDLQEVMEMELDPLENRAGASGAPAATNLDFILDIPMEVSVELGRSKMLISDLLQLGQGSVIELTKLAGEPLEVLVNQKLIARGEVVVVNEKFGIRLTDIVSPTERVKRLG
jgi:flagellar motor switch protein FliN